MALASQTVKRLQLELGGKNIAVILDDADVDLTVGAMIGEQCFNSGQTCGAPGRFYIHEKGL